MSLTALTECRAAFRRTCAPALPVRAVAGYEMTVILLGPLAQHRRLGARRKFVAAGNGNVLTVVFVDIAIVGANDGGAQVRVCRLMQPAARSLAPGETATVTIIMMIIIDGVQCTARAWPRRNAGAVAVQVRLEEYWQQARGQVGRRAGCPGERSPACARHYATHAVHVR